MVLMHCAAADAQPRILNAESFRHYFDSFNRDDHELHSTAIPNSRSWEFMSPNIPLLDCPDSIISQTYYFRWWTYRKHIKKTPEGFIISEFLPDVPWAGKYNGISCPAAFHFYEGRWLHDTTYLSRYADYWFHGGGDPRRYSFWAADAIYNFCLVSGDFSLAERLLPDLIQNYREWEKQHFNAAIGLFWQTDNRDGMEVSICGNPYGGKGYRATINSYMYGDAIAIAKIARLSNQPRTAIEFENKARAIKNNVQQKLWDNNASFFKVLPPTAGAALCDTRELHGYTPWYFNLADPQYDQAWKFLMDSSYFYAPFGPTSAERSHPGFTIAYTGHECQWNGPSWPYATTVTLTALANLLNSGRQEFIGKEDYYQLLSIYARSHSRIREEGKLVPWIDENLNPFNGDWISRTRLKTWDNGTWSPEKGGEERGKDYNHSAFCDLVITGLIGLRPQPNNSILIHPLLPEGKWDYFCLDNVRYHGRILTVVYDRTGKKYKKGKGLSVYIDGKKAASVRTLKKLTATNVY